MTDHWLCKTTSPSLLRISNHTTEKLAAELWPAALQSRWSVARRCCSLLLWDVGLLSLQSKEMSWCRAFYPETASQKVSQSSLSLSLTVFSFLLQRVNKCSSWEYCSHKLETTILFFTYCLFFFFLGIICLHLHLYDIEKYQIIYFLKLFYFSPLEISSNCTSSQLPKDWCQ